MRIGWLAGADDGLARAVAAVLEEDSAVDGVMPLELGTVPHDAPPPVDVVLDLVSLRVPFYRSAVHALASRGVIVVDDPATVGTLDRFVALDLAAAAGVAMPRTRLLPAKAYGEQVPAEALRHLEYPLPWADAVTSLGGRGYVKGVSFVSPLSSVYVDGVDELLAVYDRTGVETVMLQETLPWDRYLRAFVVGGGEAFLSGYDPAYVHYTGLEAFSEAECAAAKDLALTVSRALALDLNGVDLVVTGDGVRVLDPCRPQPDLPVAALDHALVEGVARALARLMVARGSGASAPRLARMTVSKASGRRTERPRKAVRKTKTKVRKKVTRKKTRTKKRREGGASGETSA